MPFGAMVLESVLALGHFFIDIDATVIPYRVLFLDSTYSLVYHLKR